MDIVATVEENQERLRWLEGIAGAYGYMLGKKGATIEAFLRGTIGSKEWLVGLTDDEWATLWNEIMPSVFKEGHRRSAHIDGVLLQVVEIDEI